MDTLSSSSDQQLPNNLTSQKPLSTSQSSLRSIPDNDSNATLSADETPGSHGDRPPQQQYPGSVSMSAMPGGHGPGKNNVCDKPIFYSEFNCFPNDLILD